MGFARVEPSEYVDELARRVIGRCIEVHRQLGPGFPESVYEEALSLELRLAGLSFERQVAIAISYKGMPVGHGRLDLLVDKALIVELKSVDALASVHSGQVLAYLKATNLRLGLLINFNTPQLRQGFKRILHAPQWQRSP